MIAIDVGIDTSRAADSVAIWTDTGAIVADLIRVLGTLATAGTAVVLVGLKIAASTLCAAKRGSAGTSARAIFADLA